MIREFAEGAEHGRQPGPPRPQVQRQARALTLAAPPISQRETEGGLTYPYPGKGVSGETTN